MKLLTRAQICPIVSIHDSRTSSPEIESDCFFARCSHFERQATMTKANGKMKDNKKAKHAKKQREKQKEETEHWAIKLIQWRANKAEKKLSNRAS